MAVAELTAGACACMLHAPTNTHLLEQVGHIHRHVDQLQPLLLRLLRRRGVCLAG